MERHINSTFAYVRVSTDKQDNSLEMQRDKILAYCKFQKLSDPIFLIDEHISGGVPILERPAGSKLLKQKNVNIVSIKLDRLFRSVVDALNMKELWQKSNNIIHLVNEDGVSINTQTATGRFMFTIRAAAGEWEKNTISERTSAGLQHKKQNLEKYGRIPYGFKEIPGATVEKDGKTIQKYKIVKNGEMPIIERIFEMRKTTTYDGIAETLNRENVPTKNNKRWYASTIRYILKNKIYQ